MNRKLIDRVSFYHQLNTRRLVVMKIKI